MSTMMHEIMLERSEQRRKEELEQRIKLLERINEEEDFISGLKVFFGFVVFIAAVCWAAHYFDPPSSSPSVGTKVFEEIESPNEPEWLQQIENRANEAALTSSKITN